MSSTQSSVSGMRGEVQCRCAVPGNGTRSPLTPTSVKRFVFISSGIANADPYEVVHLHHVRALLENDVCSGDKPFPVIAQETRSGQTRTIRSDDPRWGRALTLLTAGAD